MKPNRITEPLDLLDEAGLLVRPGWATAPHWRYDRSRIRAPWFRVKEWDYYYVLDQQRGYGITFTFSDLGYAGLFAVCWLDLKSGTFAQFDALKLLPRGRTGFAADSGPVVVDFEGGGLTMKETVTAGRRTIEVDCPGFRGPAGERGLGGRIELSQPADLESMAIATDWRENRRAF